MFKNQAGGLVGLWNCRVIVQVQCLARWWGLFAHEKRGPRQSMPSVTLTAEVSAKAGPTDDMLQGQKFHLNSRLLSINRRSTTNLHHNVVRYVLVQLFSRARRQLTATAPPTAANMGANLKDTTAAPAKVRS